MERGVVLGNLAGIACMIIWSLNFPLVVSILKTWDAIALAPARMILAGLTVLVFALLFGQTRELVSLLKDKRFLFASAMFGISAMFFMSAQARVDAVSAAVIVSSMPLFSALFGWLAGTEKPGWRLAIAILLTIAGGALTSLVSAQGSGSEASFAGFGSMLAAVIFYVWYTREMVVRFSGAPDLTKTAGSMLVAAVPCLVAAAIFSTLGGGLRIDLSASVLLQVFFMACVTIGASSVLWLWTGRAVGVTVAAMHHNLVPFYVILLGAFAGTIVTANHVAGAVLVIAGAVLAQLRPRKARIGVTQPVAPGRE
jgi:drug/metabolite transporter (DMT)-like permease